MLLNLKRTKRIFFVESALKNKNSIISHFFLFSEVWRIDTENREKKILENIKRIISETFENGVFWYFHSLSKLSIYVFPLLFFRFIWSAYFIISSNLTSVGSCEWMGNSENTCNMWTYSSFLTYPAENWIKNSENTQWIELEWIF